MVIRLVRLIGFGHDFLCTLNENDLLNTDGYVTLHSPVYIKIQQLHKDSTASVEFMELKAPFSSEDKDIKVQVKSILWNYAVNTDMENSYRSFVSGIVIPQSSIITAP